MAGKLYILPQVSADEENFVAENMRLADAEECHLIAGVTPSQAVRQSVERATATWCAYWDDEPACVFGINRRGPTSPVARPWLLGTPAVLNMGSQFLRASRPYMDRYKRAFPQMENWVHAENEAAIVWLRWLGFDMDEPKPTGWAGAPFIRFHWGMR